MTDVWGSGKREDSPQRSQRSTEEREEERYTSTAVYDKMKTFARNDSSEE